MSTRAWTALAAVVGAPRVLFGCPVCFDSADPNVLRFYSISTLFLSLVPFALIGGVVLTAWRLQRNAAIPDVPPPLPRS
jgi:hypothetical protein